MCSFFSYYYLRQSVVVFYLSFICCMTFSGFFKPPIFHFFFLFTVFFIWHFLLWFLPVQTPFCLRLLQTPLHLAACSCKVNSSLSPCAKASFVFQVWACETCTYGRQPVQLLFIEHVALHIFKSGFFLQLNRWLVRQLTVQTLHRGWYL